MNYKNVDQWKSDMLRKAKALDLSIENMYIMYLLESFAEKIVFSEYADEIIFRGGFLLSNIMGFTLRTTRDIDITYTSQNYDSEDIVFIINEICKMKTDCPFEFFLENLRKHLNEREEAGYGISMKAQFEKMVLYFKIDLSCGGLVFPKEINFQMHSITQDKVLDILTYPIENVIAEKFETLLDRGVTNGRMRDFYDIYEVCSNKEKYGFQEEQFGRTIKKVIDNRSTTYVIEEAEDIIEDIRKSSEFNKFWNEYLRINNKAKKISLDDLFIVLSQLTQLLK